MWLFMSMAWLLEWFLCMHTSLWTSPIQFAQTVSWIWLDLIFEHVGVNGTLSKCFHMCGSWEFCKFQTSCQECFPQRLSKSLDAWRSQSLRFMDDSIYLEFGTHLSVRSEGLWSFPDTPLIIFLFFTEQLNLRQILSFWQNVTCKLELLWLTSCPCVYVHSQHFFWLGAM